MPDRVMKSYEVLVKEGRELLRRDERLTSEMCWAWGDLALEVAPMLPGGGLGTHHGRGEAGRLRDWAEDIGWFAMGRKLSTLDNYRKVAAAWRAARRRAASFGSHEAARSRPEVLRDGMTRAEVREAITGKKSKVPASIAEETAADLMEGLKLAARDPDVVEAIAADNDAASELRIASSKVREIEDREAAEHEQATRPRLVSFGERYRARSLMRQARYRLNDALAGLRRADLDEDEREDLLAVAQEVEVSLGWLLSYLESGSFSFDTELARLLAQGEGS